MAVRSANHGGKPERDNLQIAFRAGIAGFACSVTLMLLHFFLGQLAPSSAPLQSSVEAACVLLWPSAVLLLGAQTSHGGVVLFLLSACLNAGYFIFAAMLFVAAFDKIRSHVRALDPVAVNEPHSTHQVPEVLGIPRPTL